MNGVLPKEGVGTLLSQHRARHSLLRYSESRRGRKMAFVAYGSITIVYS